MYIYGLIDPIGPEIFYVGRTAKLSARLRKHKKNSNHAGKKLRERITRIKRAGEQLEMVVLERTEDKHREYAWIQFFEHLGLVNRAKHPTAPYIKKTSEELSRIARESWIRKRRKFEGFSRQGWTLRDA